MIVYTHEGKLYIIIVEQFMVKKLNCTANRALNVKNEGIEAEIFVH